MDKYVYEGPVEVFDKCVTNHWTAETIAPSVSKAKSNLAYQFKKQHNRTTNTKVTLPGKLTRVI